MKDVDQLKPLSAFEWASVCQYIVYISSVAGLKEFNCSEVSSFPLARVGPEKLIARKERVLVLLRGNKIKVERFAGCYEEQLGEGEMSILRSMYVQFKRSIRMVEDQVRIAKLYQTANAPVHLPGAEEMENDLPF